MIRSLATQENPCFQVHGVIDAKRSAEDILKRSIQIAEAFHKAGVKENDVVTIISENCFDFIELAFGVFFLNAILAPLNSSYSKSEWNLVKKSGFRPRLKLSVIQRKKNCQNLWTIKAL